MGEATSPSRSMRYRRHAPLWAERFRIKRRHPRLFRCQRRCDAAVTQEAKSQEEALDDSRYDRPIVQQARAALEQAKLDLAYTRITAPFDGIITHKSVHVGHRVQPGEPLMADVPTQHLYIVANFKETQLTYVRVGQKTTIEADIYPDHIYQGHVDSISMGTGAAFSLLPPRTRPATGSRSSNGSR